MVSFESEGIEIHDVSTLAPLQRIPLIGATSMSVSAFSAGRTRVKASGIYASTQDQLYHYSMIPIAAQVSYNIICRFMVCCFYYSAPNDCTVHAMAKQIKILMQQNAYEEALSLCALCKEQSAGDGEEKATSGGDITVKQIHEQFAFSLHQKGDFEGAVTQYIAAGTAPASVIALFPELIPNALVTALNSAPSASMVAEVNPATLGLSAVTPPPAPLQKLSGMVLQRAASALLSFCEHYRADVIKAAGLALQQRSLAAQSNLTNLLQDNTVELRDMGAYDSDERIRTAALLDTVMLSANMICSPPRCVMWSEDINFPLCA